MTQNVCTVFLVMVCVYISKKPCQSNKTECEICFINVKVCLFAAGEQQITLNFMQTALFDFIIK